ncbi:MAG: BMP family lipoprotein, partial [Limimaricola sp.]
LNKIAPDYPDTRFAIIDMVVDQPNVQSVVFTEEEGSYLAGVMAGLASQTDIVGFIGGMDIPLIHKFEWGYAQGFKATKPEGKVLINYTGTTPAAWNDPVKGGELAKAQISQGADVVYAAAGGTGIGVLQTAADQGILSIGVDSNQNYLQPGKVLTSMVKRVDNAVYDAFEAGTDIETGINVMGVNNEGVGIAVDEHNEALVTEEMTAAVEDAKAKIASGEIEVHDYMSDEGCPSLDF